jgi:hypothetical protein
MRRGTLKAVGFFSASTITPSGLSHFWAKVKGKVRPVTDQEGTDGKYRYSTTLSLTSALDGDEQTILGPIQKSICLCAILN